MTYHNHHPEDIEVDAMTLRGTYTPLHAPHPHDTQPVSQTLLTELARGGAVAILVCGSALLLVVAVLA